MFSLSDKFKEEDLGTCVHEGLTKNVDVKLKKPYTESMVAIEKNIKSLISKSDS